MYLKGNTLWGFGGEEKANPLALSEKCKHLNQEKNHHLERLIIKKSLRGVPW